MKQSASWFITGLAAVSLMVLAPDPARPAGELCPMGGVMVKAEIVKEKALDWAQARENTVIDGAVSDTWTVLARSRKDKDIALLIGPGYVFFGVAGRGGEVYPRDLEKALGKDLGKLREAVRKEMTDLWKAGAVRVEGADVQKISDAAGLGFLEKDARDWTLKTMDCQAVDLPTSGL